MQSYRQSVVGKMYGQRSGKNIIPAKINEAMVRCKTGKTSGSCIDLFDLINEALTKLNQLDNECWSNLLEEKNIFENSKKFFLIISLLAWGDKVPADNKDNWLSQSNIFVYCKNKKFLKTVMEPDDFDNLVSASIQSFPFEKLPFDFDENSAEYINNKAIKKISSEEILSKSILSIRCEGI